MPAIFDFLYREYCRARLAEMRKQLRLISGPAAQEADCDISDLGSSDTLDRGLGEEATATKQAAPHGH
jgi:hypothetical protein